ncbi:MAG: hypothetical protein ABSE22_19690 [Xanthobacteraceae bacterium]|jgi:hypothetical protein
MTSPAFDSRHPDFDTAAEPLVPAKSENDNEASTGATDSSQSDNAKRNQTTPKRGVLATLWYAYRVHEGEQLSAEDSASTIFRFFRSDHVVDLKLFFKLAFYLFLTVICVGTLYAVAKPAIHLLSHPMAGAVYYGGRRAFILHFLTVSTSDVLPALAAFVAPAITICGGIMAWTYLSAATRLGVVDLFGCEIRTLCRVSTAFDIGKIYVARYDGNAIDNQPTQSGGFKSEEEYFPVFSSNSHDLEALEATVVGYITEFYTYMKTFRDLQRKLQETHAPEETKWLTANSLFVLFLGFESARKAIKELIEFEPTQAENILIILLTELTCYPFLCRRFVQDELRLSRLTLRLGAYDREVRELIATVDAHGNDADWAAAKRTLPELIERYNDMLKTLTKVGVEEAQFIPPLIGRRTRKSEAATLPVQTGSENQPVAVAAT